MPLTDAALNEEVLTVDTQSVRTWEPDPLQQYSLAATYSNARCVVEATLAFLAVFLVSGFVAGVVRGNDWASSIAAASMLGVGGAGLQLLLMAVRARRELEADAEF